MEEQIPVPTQQERGEAGQGSQLRLEGITARCLWSRRFRTLLAIFEREMEKTENKENHLGSFIRKITLTRRKKKIQKPTRKGHKKGSNEQNKKGIRN